MIVEELAVPAEEVVHPFALLGLDARLVKALAARGYDEPTPIQREAIPPLIAGKDLLGQAATGTGKTAAFALPLLHRLAAMPKRSPLSTLILVPTRELAMQVAEALTKYGAPLGVRVLAIYGGAGYDQQFRALHRGVDVVVATPGRALDHLKKGTLKLANLTTVVLDEADEMLNMGFAEDLEAILSATPDTRQTMLFSATMPARIDQIARKHLREPVVVRIERPVLAEGESPAVRRRAYLVQGAYKLPALLRILETEDPTAAIVFCRTRTEAEQLSERLTHRGQRCETLHGGMSQEQRDRVMRAFRAGACKLLLATDVAARGLDVNHLTHVVNFHIPAEAESFVHRIGRVGRAGREGTAITLVEPHERRWMYEIERTTGQEIEWVNVPSVAELNAKRAERTAAQLRDVLAEGNLDREQPTVAALLADHSAEDIAKAALALLRRTTGQESADEEIPAPAARRDKPRVPAPPTRGPRGMQERSAARTPIQGGARGIPSNKPGMVRVFVGGGYADSITPRDLVGAIANEAGVSGRDIGAIELNERNAIVEVPGDVADYVIECLQGARIKGKKFPARRDRR